MTAFDYRLVSYAEDGVSDRLELPDVISSQVSVPYAAGGAITLEVPRSGRNVDRLLGDGLSWVAVEVCRADGSWVEPADCRFVVLGEDGDEIDLDSSTAKLSAVSPDWVLTRMLWRAGATVGDRDDERAFAAASAGEIMRTVIDESLARGVADRFALDLSSFTASVDSAGKPWGLAISAAFKVGSHAGAALAMLAEQGMVTRSWDGLTLRLFDGGGPSQTLADLAVGRDITEAPVKKTRADVATVALVRGDDGIAVEVVDAAGVGRWGRLETTIDQGGVTDVGTLRALGEASLRVAAEQRAEYTHGVAFGAARWRPLIDYRPGDSVRSLTVAGEREFRVRAITLTRDAGGTVAGNVILNDRIAEFEERVTRRLTGMSGGATVAGSGAMPRPPSGPLEGDTTVPNPPTGLLLDSDVYHEQGPVGPGTWATLRASWVAPATNTDGSPCGDLRSYELEARSLVDPRWRKPSNAEGRPLGEVSAEHTSAAFSPFWVGVGYEVRVRARDKADHVSEWSPWVSVVTAADKVPPPVPGPPSVVLRVGVAVITWDGKGAAGEGLPADWRHAEVWLRYADGGEVIERMAGVMDEAVRESGVVVADVPYGVEAEAWLVSVDRSGNKSGRGEGALFTPEPVVDVEPTITELDAAKTKIMNAAQMWWDASTTLNAKLDTLKTETLAQAGRPVVSDRAPTAADGAGLPVGATWTVAAGGRMTAFFRWSGATWAPLALDAVVIPKIDIGSGTAGMLDVARLTATGAEIGELVADRIWADVVTGRKIAANQISLAADSVNLYIDEKHVDPVMNAHREGLALKPGEFTFTDEAVRGSDGAMHNVFIAHDYEAKLIHSFYLVSKPSEPATLAGQAYKVTPGQTMWLDVPVGIETKPLLDGTTPAGERWGRLLVYTLDAAGAVSAHILGGSTVTPASGAYLAARLTGSFAVPDGIVGVVPVAQFAPASNRPIVWDGASVRVTDGSASPFLDATVIAGGSITTNHLAALSVTAGKLAALSVTSDKIAANAVTAGKIEAGAITAEKISVNALDGKVITGATIRTGTAWPMVQMDSGGLWAANKSGAYTFRVEASTGNVFALGDFLSMHPSNTSYSAKLTANAFDTQPGLMLRSGHGWALEGALVAKSPAESGAGSYVPGSVVLHGAEYSLNSTGRSELTLLPNGRGWSLMNQRGPYGEAGIYSDASQIVFRGRLAPSQFPVFEAHQIDVASGIAPGSGSGLTISWTWPDGDDSYQVVNVTPLASSSGDWPKLFATLRSVTRTGCTFRVYNDGADHVANYTAYITKTRVGK